MTVVQIDSANSPWKNPATLGALVWFAFGGPVDYVDGKRTVRMVTVSSDDLHTWFRDLGLDEGLLPPQTRRIDKFRTVTSAARHRYEVTGGRADLFIEEVASGNDQVVRNVMRRLTDINRVTLATDHVATLKFIRGGRSSKGKRSTGDHWRWTILSKVKEPDRSEIERFIAGIDVAYRDGAEALDPTAMRGIIRRYLLTLHGVQLRGSGGIYFVPASTADAVPALSEVVRRINSPGCSMDYTEFAATLHNRTIVTKAFQAEVVDDCGTLDRAIDSRIRDASIRGKLAPRHYGELHARYDAIKERAEVYGAELSLPMGPASEALTATRAAFEKLNALTLWR